MDIITIIGLVGGLALGAGAVVAAEQNKKKEEGPKKKKSSENASGNAVESNNNASPVAGQRSETANANGSGASGAQSVSSLRVSASSSVSAAVVEKEIIKEEKAEQQSLDVQKKKITVLINGIYALESAMRQLNETISEDEFLEKMKKSEYNLDFVKKYQN